MNTLISKNKTQEKLIREVAKIAGYLWEKGWAERNAGNISIRIDALISGKFGGSDHAEFVELEQDYPALASQAFFITATGKRMRDLADKPYKNSLFIQLNEAGNAYALKTFKKDQKEMLKPTSELNTHLAIHQMIAERSSNERVVMHVHATELISLTQHPSNKSEEKINKILWGMHPETIIFIPGGIGFVPYELPGSQAIASATVEKLKEHDIVIWQKHGVFAIGSNISDMFDNIDILCKSAKIWFLCRSAGFEPEGLSELQLGELKQLVNKFNAV